MKTPPENKDALDGSLIANKPTCDALEGKWYHLII